MASRLCGHCRRLLAQPTRIDIPENLRRKLSEGPPGSMLTTGQHAAVFACVDCSANWQWSTTRGWVEFTAKKPPSPVTAWLQKLGFPGRAAPGQKPGARSH